MALADLRTELHDVLAEFEDWLAAVTVLEWVLLALALGIVLWIMARVRAAAELGPIEVMTIEQDGQPVPSIQLLGLTARLRQRIEEVGFRPPPQVPSGAPTGDLLSAIEASPLPQANWIAALLNAMPRPQPISYRLTTTIQPEDKAASYWLRPAGGGSPLIKTVDAKPQFAIKRIAEEILMHVSKNADDIFPSWARWESPRGLRLYLGGLEWQRDGRHVLAKSAFERAAKAEPENVIVRLRLYNARERLATEEPVPRAELLRDYLDLVRERPELVEARYRTATLAGVVADAYVKATPGIRGQMAVALCMQDRSDVQLVKDLRRTQELHLDQALALLRPWFVPLIWHRARYGAEPRADERRRLKRTLRISRACSFARGWNSLSSTTKQNLEASIDEAESHRLAARDAVKGGDRGAVPAWLLWAAIVGVRWLWAWVRYPKFLNLSRTKLLLRWRADRSGVDWRVYYNASCFYALIGARESAYRFLGLALSEGGRPQLRTWIAVDPDLTELRDANPTEWTTFTAGALGAGGHVTPRHPLRELRSILSVPARAALGVLVLLVLFVLLVVFPWVAFALVLPVAWSLIVAVRYFTYERTLSERTMPA
jgi:hypothetical protein